MSDLLNLFDFEHAAAERLTTAAFDYYAGGSADELTLRDNCAAFTRIRLRPRVMIDVRSRDHSVSLFEKQMSMPVLIAPMAFQMLAHPDGELATARAANAANTPMILSSLSTVAMEDVVAATSAPVWFQLYIFRDRELTRALVQRAEQAGCSALVVTVDAPMQGNREKDIRNRFTLPTGLFMKNLSASGNSQLPISADGSGLAAFINSKFDRSLTWSDVAWLQSQTTLPVIVKGVVRGDDAAKAVASGAQGIVVSNHGGRQLDSAIASIDAVRDVVHATAGAIPVLMDGGVRRGTDIIKAIAFGASAVLLGRPVLWGLAVDGEQGVAKILNILREEFDIAMGLCGCTTVSEITADLVA